MLVSRNGELETDGNVPVIQECILKHDEEGFTFNNGPYFVMERFGKLSTRFEIKVLQLS